MCVVKIYVMSCYACVYDEIAKTSFRGEGFPYFLFAGGQGGNLYEVEIKVCYIVKTFMHHNQT